MNTIRISSERWVGRGVLGVALLFLLQQAKPLLLPVVVAVVFAFVLAPAVRALRRIGVPEFVGAALMILSVLALVVLLASVLAAPAAAMWARAPAVAQRLLDEVQRVGWSALPPPSHGAQPAGPAADAARRDLLSAGLASEGLQITREVLGHTLSFAVSAAATVFLLYFLLISEHWLVVRTAQALSRPRSRALLLGGLRQAQREIGLFVTTMGLMSLLLGAATGLALAAIGFPNAVLWSGVTAVLTFVPYIGPALVTVALVLAGSAVYGAGLGLLLPAAVFLGLHFIEGNFLSPFVMGSRLRISPVFVFLSVLLWSWLWGIAGAFVAVPLLLGLRATCHRVRRLAVLRLYLEGGVQLPSLRALLRPRVR